MKKTARTANKVSSGNSIDQLLDNLRKLVIPSTAQPVVKPPTPRQPAILAALPVLWFAVRYDNDLTLLDPTTLRQEPERTPHPHLFRHPLIFPWCYIPAVPDLRTVANPGPRDAIRFINSRLLLSAHHDSGSKGLALQYIKHLADIVQAIGGRVIHQVAEPAAPPVLVNGLKLTPRDKAVTIARHRSQPQRYSRQLRSQQQLAEHV